MTRSIISEAIVGLAPFIEKTSGVQLRNGVPVEEKDRIIFKPGIPLSALIDRLRELEDEQQPIDSRTVQALREELNYIYAQPAARQPHLYSRRQTFKEALYTTLIALATISPINDEDDTTLELISDVDQIVFSSGRQYDINSLVQYHKVRPNSTTPEGVLSEFFLGKEFHVPTHNGEIDRSDIEHFKKTVRQKNIKLPKLKEMDLLQYGLSKLGTFFWGSAVQIVKSLFGQSTPDQYIEMAFSRLRSKGLTQEVFNRNWQRQDARNDFSNEHIEALERLTERQQLDIIPALREISGLNAAQAYVIYSLYERGVHGELLRQQWDSDNITFTRNHADALIFLMRDLTPPLNFDEAILELDQLTSEEAASLISLYSLGLRGKHFGFRSGHWNHSAHGALFRVLTEKQHLTPQQIMRESSLLSNEEAKALATFYDIGIRGIDLRRDPDAIVSCYRLSVLENESETISAYLVAFQRTHNMTLLNVMQEIKGLNKAERTVLFELYSKGLRGDHLRENFPRNASPADLKFDATHAAVLTHLINRKGHAADVACKMLKGKSKDIILDHYHFYTPPKSTVIAWLTTGALLLALPESLALGLMTAMVYSMRTTPQVDDITVLEQADVASEDEGPRYAP